MKRPPFQCHCGLELLITLGDAGQLHGICPAGHRWEQRTCARCGATFSYNRSGPGRAPRHCKQHRYRTSRAAARRHQLRRK